MRRDRRLVVMVLLAAAVVMALGSVGGATASSQQDSPRVVFATENIGCAGSFMRLVCDGFLESVRRTGVQGRIVTPTLREDTTDTLSLLARQRYDAILVFGNAFLDSVSAVAPRHRDARFGYLDRSQRELDKRLPNVQGVVFRTSEAAYVAGWLAAKMEKRNAGRDAVGIVAGFSFPAVNEFVIGFRAGAKAAVPGMRVLTDYSGDFLDRSRCIAIARRHVARGAGVLFNVAGNCGLGTLSVAKERGIWAVGVDEDQSFLGRFVLTSVLKRFDAGFLRVLRQVQAGQFRTGADTILDAGDGAVGLAPFSPAVPGPLRAELRRVERRIVRGDILVPGAYPRQP